MKTSIIVLNDSVINSKAQLHTFLQKYYSNEKAKKQPGKYSIWLSIPLRVVMHALHKKDYLSLELVQLLHLTPSEIQALYSYAYKHEQTIQVAILSLIQEILKEQKEIQVLLRDKKLRRLEVALWKEMEWRESEG